MTTPTDHSSSIDEGETAQELCPADDDRGGFWLKNEHPTEDLWINELGEAAEGEPSLQVSPGGIHEYPAHGIPRGAISIFSFLTGHIFTCRTW